MHKEMTLAELKKHQSDLINAFLRDHSPAEAVRVANKILMDLDNLEVLEEDYLATRMNTHYSVQKKESLADKVRSKVRTLAGL